MANKVILGKRPKTFKPLVVEFTLPDGEIGSIEVKYVYRTRTEFGEMIDAIFKDAQLQKPADGEFSMQDLMARTSDKNAAYLAKIIAEWNLDEKLNESTLRQLADEVPAAATALMEKYREAAIEGRLGN